MPDPDSRWYLPMHNAGMEMLKQKMWQNLGVDYVPGYQHMDDTQTYDDRKRGVIYQGKPDAGALKYQQQQMEKELRQPMLEKLDQTPQPIALHPMAAALQGPQDPAMSALFSQPAPKLQQMAGDVVKPPLNMFAPNINQWNLNDLYDKVNTQNAGYTNANPDAFAQGYMTGKIKVLNPAGNK